MPRLPFQPLIADAAYTSMLVQRKFYAAFHLPVISTARPFSFYRRVFFDNAHPEFLHVQLQDKTIADIGCGLTPFIADSMFQWCQRRGIDFYGIDPKIGTDFRFNTFDRVKTWASGSRAPLDRNAPGMDKALSAYANALPFNDHQLDLILSSWLLFAWIDDPAMLADIFNEFHRVLRQGGSVKLYPLRDWQRHQTSHAGFQQALERFDVDQQFLGDLWGWASMPAYVTTFTKRPD